MKQKLLQQFSFRLLDFIKLKFFITKKNSRSGWRVAQFFVDAKSSSSILYPQIFSNSFEAKIISPIEMPLKKGETYHFEINCPARKFLALIIWKKFYSDAKIQKRKFYS